MKSAITKTLFAGAIGMIAALSQSQAQTPDAPAAGPAAAPDGAPARPARAGRGAPAETWYVNKKDSVVYKAPNRPLWKLADLLKMHAGKSNWSQPILKDELEDVTYNSGAPGTKFIPRMHNQTPTVFFIMRGEVHFAVEGQDPVTATRGGIVNIMANTIYSYEVSGSDNALWININPLGFRTEYPTTEPPPPAQKGATLTKVAFAHRPGAYTGNNKLYFNLFDAIAKCQPTGGVVNDDHIHASPLTGFVNTAEYTSKCPNGPGTIRGGAASTAPFDPKATFGHLHEGVREWWIVQAGQIQGRFEKTGEFHAVEGDVLNAEQDMWHQMGLEAPSGPSVRTAISAYSIANMQNTATPAGAGGD
jgi:mannose-6-phosphate isomerase-like protein (cupin superfamily)